MSNASISLPLPTLPREKEAVARPLLERLLQAMTQLVTEAPLAILQQAAAAPTGAGSMATLISHLSDASPRLASADPEAAAVARAAAIKRSLLESTPTYSTDEVAELLDMSAEGVRKRRLAHKLVAVPHANDWRFPAWQFAQPTSKPSRQGRRAPVRRSTNHAVSPTTPSGTVAGLERVLAALPVESAWVRLEILTTPLPEYRDQSVVDLLRAGDVETALHVVSTYGEQGA